MKAYPRNALRRLLGWPALRVRGVLENLLRQLDRCDLLEEAHIGLFDRDFCRPFAHILDRLTLDAGKDVWVEKTPVHLHYIDQIQSSIPRTKFIHIVRNGADVVASLYKITNEHPREWSRVSKTFFRGYSIEQCVALWNHDILLSAKWIKEPNHILVRYERLLENPADVLKDVCHFLEVDYTNKMEKPEQVFHKITSSFEVWKIENAEGIHRPKSKFDTIFDEKEKDYVLSNLVQLDLIDWGVRFPPGWWTES